jgi:hypothetical protein
MFSRQQLKRAATPTEEDLGEICTCRVKLPELLIEVDNELGFTRHFLTPAQRQEPSPEDICAVLAAIMVHGGNLGT